MKNTIIAVFIIILTTVVGIYCFNYFQLQTQMNDVIKEDYRNNGIEVRVHYTNYVKTSELVYDLKSVSGDKSMTDVFRVFLQFAEKLQSRNYDLVKLSFRGTTKFMINGRYFQQLGEEYSWQNPVYTTRTFPENLMKPDGSSAYPTWTGGWLGVTQKQMEDFNDFHRKWYLDDVVR